MVYISELERTQAILPDHLKRTLEVLNDLQARVARFELVKTYSYMDVEISDKSETAKSKTKSKT